jgi:hypothetical protein
MKTLSFLMILSQQNVFEFSIPSMCKIHNEVADWCMVHLGNFTKIVEATRYQTKRQTRNKRRNSSRRF